MANKNLKHTHSKTKNEIWKFLLQNLLLFLCFSFPFCALNNKFISYAKEIAFICTSDLMLSQLMIHPFRQQQKQ